VAPAAPAGLCLAGETPYFSCQARSGKWIGVCGMRGGPVQYRYGRPGAVELAYPPARSPSAASAASATSAPASAGQALRFAHYSRPLTERYELAFSIGSTRYAVFDYSEDARQSAGVQVQTAGQPERQVLCRGAVQSRVEALEDLLPCDAENALNLGRCR
jgi:hypothetical protein